MKNKLTPNFNWIEECILYYKKKDEIINLLCEIESFNGDENNLKEAITKINNVLELFLNFTLEKLQVDFTKETKLIEKINFLAQHSSFIDSKFCFNIMHNIRHQRNHIAHSHNENDQINLNHIDLLQSLNNLHKILIIIFNKLNIEDNFQNFDTNYYSWFKHNSISAINEIDRIKNSWIPKELQNLKIEKDNIINWLSIKNTILYVPIYQRKYEWNESNILALIDDILARIGDNAEHYFGTIAQKKTIGEKNNDPNKIKIIDGQQRLTTSLLLLSAIKELSIKRNYYKNINEISWYKEIISNHNDKEKLSSYIHNPGGSEKLNKSFKSTLDNIMPYNDSKLIDDTKYSTNYKLIYKILDKKLKTKLELDNFINVFLYKFSVATISFDNNKFSSKKEMEIFENLNSKGVMLSITDLIKNHLFNFCSEELLNNEEYKIVGVYNSMLTNAELNKNNDDNDLLTFYSLITEIILGNEISKNEREKFLTIKNGINYFLGKFINIDNYQKFEALIKYMQNYLYLFKESKEKDFGTCFLKFIKVDHIIDIITDKKKKQLFFYFEFLIFYWMEKNKINYDFDRKINQEWNFNKIEIRHLQDLFLTIVKYILKTQIITKQGDSSIKRILSRISHKFYNQINDNIFNNLELLCENIILLINDEFNEYYDLSKLKINLENSISEKTSADLLILIEMHLMNSIYSDSERIDRRKKSLEHIMPQNIDKWIKKFDNKLKTEYLQNHSYFNNKLGNYLILTPNSNSKCANEPFLIKKERVYNELVSPLYINKTNNDIDVSNKTKWTFDDIKRRTNALIEYILKNIFN